MCKICVNEEASGEELTVVSQLADLVGGAEMLRFEDGWSDEMQAEIRAMPDSCLCPINTIATLEAAGYAASVGDTGAVHFAKKRPA